MLSRLRMAVFRVANTPDEELRLLPVLERTIVPLLSASSFLYAYILALRYKLYLWRVLKQTRLPLPVISVGNISWGGNGKTPLAEFLAWRFLECGLSPLLLTRGYGNGDEARLLECHLQGTGSVIGVGSNRVGVAKVVLCKHGVRDICDIHGAAKCLDLNKNFTTFDGMLGTDKSKLVSHCQMLPPGVSYHKWGITQHEDGMGIVIMDDGMQHWRVERDIDIVIVNAITSFGNGHLLPRGPLREPLEALHRADIAVIHHANLVTPAKVKDLKEKLKALLPPSAGVFCTQMVPFSLCHVQKTFGSSIGQGGVSKRTNMLAPLNLLKNSHLLCISGIGCPESLTLTLEQLGPVFIERMDFPDHHYFEMKDLITIKKRLFELETKLDCDVVIVSTEKDYARSPSFFQRLDNDNVYILQSRLEIINDSSSAVDFRNLIAAKLQCWK